MRQQSEEEQVLATELTSCMLSHYKVRVQRKHTYANYCCIAAATAVHQLNYSAVYTGCIIYSVLVQEYPDLLQLCRNLL